MCEVVDGQCLWQHDISVGSVGANFTVGIVGLLAVPPRPLRSPTVNRMLQALYNNNAFYWPEQLVRLSRFARFPIARFLQLDCWPPQVVYDYDTTAAANPVVQSQMEEAILRYHTLTPVRFRRRTTEFDYIKVIAGTNCYSVIGRIGGAQTLSLAVNGTCSGARAHHEIAHALGLYHTQSRQDRDEYITLNADNINTGDAMQYAKYPVINAFDYGEYDYGSLMHYGRWDFLLKGLEKAPNTTTFDVVAAPFAAFEAKYGTTFVGQRLGLSPLDVQLLNFMYGSCIDAPPPGQSANLCESMPCMLIFLWLRIEPFRSCRLWFNRSEWLGKWQWQSSSNKHLVQAAGRSERQELLEIHQRLLQCVLEQ